MDRNARDGHGHERRQADRGRGRRPPGRFESAYVLAAVEPATDADVALVLPEATTAAMNLFPAEFAAGLPGDVHAALVLDGAGWHGFPAG